MIKNSQNMGLGILDMVIDILFLNCYLWFL